MGDGFPEGGGRHHFFQQFFQNRVVERRIGQQALELGVLVLERLQPRRLGDVQTAELRLPGVGRRRADPVPPAQIGGLAPASCSRSTPMICSSVNLDRFMVRSSRWDGL